MRTELLTGEETAAALCLVPLPGSPDPRSIDSSWSELLPAEVRVLQLADAVGEDALPLVLLGGDSALVAEVSSKLVQAGRPAPLALLTYRSQTAPTVADRDLVVIHLEAEANVLEQMEQLSRELCRLSALDQQVRSFINLHLLDGQADAVTETTPLLELGIIDSISIVSLVAFVEADLGIPVPDGEIHPRHLADIDSIRRLIVRLDGERRRHQ